MTELSLVNSLDRATKNSTLTLEEKSLAEQSIAVLASPENINIIENRVGDPLGNETLDEYLKRAKSVIFEMIDASLRT